MSCRVSSPLFQRWSEPTQGSLLLLQTFQLVSLLFCAMLFFLLTICLWDDFISGCRDRLPSTFTVAARNYHWVIFTDMWICLQYIYFPVRKKLQAVSLTPFCCWNSKHKEEVFLYLYLGKIQGVSGIIAQNVISTYLTVVASWIYIFKKCHLLFLPCFLY